MTEKFMLCNACRKTHLTKSVIPVFERKARQPAQATDLETRLRIREGRVFSALFCTLFVFLYFLLVVLVRIIYLFSMS